MNSEKIIDSLVAQFVVKDACIPKSLGRRLEDNPSGSKDQRQEFSRASCAEDVI